MEISNAKRNYENVRRWTKDINIFEGKKTLFFPINEIDLHWYLVVIFIPDVSEGFEPYAVVLDSLGERKDSEVEKLKDFLLEELEYKYSKKTTAMIMENIKQMETIYPSIPIQQDGSSCGLYLIHYVKNILRALDDKCLSSIFMETSSWFLENVDRMRYDLSKLIKQAATKEGKLQLPYLQFFPTAAEDKAVKRVDRQKVDVVTKSHTAEAKKNQIYENTTVQHLQTDRKNMSYQEYLQNIEENEEDYTALWSYGINSKPVTKKRKDC